MWGTGGVRHASESVDHAVDAMMVAKEQGYWKKGGGRTRSPTPARASESNRLLHPLARPHLSPASSRPFFLLNPFSIQAAYSMAIDSKVEAAAREWLRQDPDETTQRQLQGLLDGQDGKALQQAFGSRLAFGTAGLRGVMGVGPNNMNVRANERRSSSHMLITFHTCRLLGSAC